MPSQVLARSWLMVGTASEAYRLQHAAKWRDEIVAGTYRVIDELAGPVAEQVGEMQARELSRGDGSAALRLVEPRWHGDDCFVHELTGHQLRLSFQVREDSGGNVDRR